MEMKKGTTALVVTAEELQALEKLTGSVSINDMNKYGLSVSEGELIQKMYDMLASED